MEAKNRRNQPDLSLNSVQQRALMMVLSDWLKSSHNHHLHKFAQQLRKRLGENLGLYQPTPTVPLTVEYDSEAGIIYARAFPEKVTDKQARASLERLIEKKELGTPDQWAFDPRYTNPETGLWTWRVRRLRRGKKQAGEDMTPEKIAKLFSNMSKEERDALRRSLG